MQSAPTACLDAAVHRVRPFSSRTLPCRVLLLHRRQVCSTRLRREAGGMHARASAQAQQQELLEQPTAIPQPAQTVPQMLGMPKGWLTTAAALGITAALLAPAPAFADTPVQIAQAVSSGPFVPGLLGDDQVREGFVSGFLLILFSELGDKTFFIAVLLAVKYRQSQGLVFAGAFGALAAMTVISVGLGLVLHEADQIFDTGGIPLDDIVAIALLLFFGVRTLQEAGDADDKAKEEEEEAQESVTAFNDAAGLVVSTFALVFAAEWGDKSFLATIALAASSSPLGVVGGAITGHGVATVIAIVGGKVLSRYVSERTLQYIGGSLFLLFAATQLLDLVRGV